MLKRGEKIEEKEQPGPSKVEITSKSKKDGGISAACCCSELPPEAYSGRVSEWVWTHPTLLD